MNMAAVLSSHKLVTCTSVHNKSVGSNYRIDFVRAYPMRLRTVRSAGTRLPQHRELAAHASSEKVCADVQCSLSILSSII